jgi:SAM-dependent methyltransferase
MEREVYERLDLLQDRHWWFAGRRAIVERVIRHYFGDGRRPSILEAGCGTGGNLAMLSRIGDPVAFEPDEYALRSAIAKADCDIRPGSLPEPYPFAGEQFDLIVALDVIEHVEKDLEGLQALRASLAPGGKLVMTVPALPWLWSAHDEHHHHYRRYTRTGLQRTLQEAGLRPVELTYYNTLLFPLAAGYRLLMTSIGSKSSNDEALPPAPLNAALRAIFSAERFVIGRLPLPIGVSLLAVAEAELT